MWIEKKKKYAITDIEFGKYKDNICCPIAYIYIYLRMNE